MSELWIPDEATSREGQEAYIKYLAGITVLREPSCEFASSFHQLELEEANFESIIISAEKLMYEGARKVITLSNPARHREGIVMEKNYGNALPIMRHIVDSTYEELSNRIGALDLACQILRPAAFIDKPVYGYIVHPHREKLLTRRLMDGLPPAAVFESILADRKLGHLTPLLVG